VQNLPITELLKMLGTQGAPQGPLIRPQIPTISQPKGQGSSASPLSAQEILALLAQPLGGRGPGK
jgi:hypothetical protein